MKTPILLIGDAPSAVTGLGRICRDLSLHIHQHLSDIFDVATFGYGGSGDRSLPFPQYSIEGMENWFLPTLPDVWHNFAGDRKGVVLTIWDASRLLWFARPDNPRVSTDKHMREWLLTRPFERWGYFPMDALGPHGRLSYPLYETIAGFDRVIAYSEWARKMIEKTFGQVESERRSLIALPHGIHTDVFRPQRVIPAKVFHEGLGFPGPKVEPGEKIIGIVATNQARKDYGLAIQAVAEVAKDTPVRLFIQTDVLERHWSIPTLLKDYGLLHRAIVNCSQVTDETMAAVYSACDLTLGIGGGEGFGYPIFESLACGTQVITGSYGGQAEWMDQAWLLPPKMLRLEGVYNCMRPVYEPAFWARQIRTALSVVRRGVIRQSLLSAELDWTNLWPRWEQWLRAQHRNLPAQTAESPSLPSSIPETDTEPAGRRR